MRTFQGMFEWISRHSDTLQVLLNGSMVVIWVAYLQVFLVSLRRQRRSEILINLSVGSGLSARCFVSNLSLEPLYLHDILVELTTESGTCEAVITDRSEMAAEQLARPSEATNQGPIKSGDYVDIGSVSDLLDRALPTLGNTKAGDIRQIRITTVANTSSSPELVGACRTYRLRRADGETDLIPTEVTATQIRSWWGRRALRRKMNERLGKI